MLNKEDIVSILNSEILSGSQYLVDVKVSAAGSQLSKVTVLIDADGGLNIDDCATVSRQLGELLETRTADDAPYRLEVSSPGVDHPLTMPRQYNSHVGRELLVALYDGKEAKGKLEEVREDAIVLIPTKDKKKKGETPEPMSIPFSDISSSKVLISFK